MASELVPGLPTARDSVEDEYLLRAKSARRLCASCSRFLDAASVADSFFCELVNDRTVACSFAYALRNAVKVCALTSAEIEAAVSGTFLDLFGSCTET